MYSFSAAESSSMMPKSVAEGRVLGSLSSNARAERKLRSHALEGLGAGRQGGGRGFSAVAASSVFCPMDCTASEISVLPTEFTNLFFAFSSASVLLASSAFSGGFCAAGPNVLIVSVCQIPARAMHSG